MRKLAEWLGRSPLAKSIQHLLFVLHVCVIFYDDAERSKVVDLIGRVKNETDIVQGMEEAYSIFMAVKSTQKVKGEIAEVGVFKGGSAKLICEAKGEKELHLFDTFEGLPEVGAVDERFRKGMYRSSENNVRSYLMNYPGVHIYKGEFPETAKPIENRKFSFVHLDVDIYLSTLNCLKFFYPRMSKGGVILCHDYMSSAGVRRAFDEFFTDKPEPVIEMPRSQCLVVKL